MGTLLKLLTKMISLVAVVLSLLVLGNHGSTVKQAQRRFPSDFTFGASSAAYQIEGGWNADDKGESVWDHEAHFNPETFRDGDNGDITADSYHNYRRDVEIARELGLDAYRFSIAWPRVLPNGRSNYVSQAGVTYYNNLIDELLRYNITPMVTLFHWDLPLRLQNLGGFMNPLFSEWFEDYARVIFENFGDRVKNFITFNEPNEICHTPLLVEETGYGDYLCAKHLLVAHARAYRLYTDEFKPMQRGECGITISVSYFAPLIDSEEDQAAAELRRQAIWGIYAEPIYSSEGGWPKEFEERVAQKSAEQGYSRSRLPEFTEEEKAFIRGTYDFFGVNHYTTYLVSATEYLEEHPVPSMDDDTNVGITRSPDWPQAASEWLSQAPDSIYNALSILAERYNNPKFYITENGWSTVAPGPMEDDDRINYYRAALESVLNCLDAGINLKGYYAWSLMDNLEWISGFTERFGLYYVDFSDPARPRVPRKSAFVYKEIIRSRVIDHSYEPTTRVMTIAPGH